MMTAVAASSDLSRRLRRKQSGRRQRHDLMAAHQSHGPRLPLLVLRVESWTVSPSPTSVLRVASGSA